MFELKIKKVENGYILNWEEYDDDDNKRTVEEVIEDNENNEEALKKLLENVADFFGYIYDKYGENNLNISFDKKGHKL